VVLTPEAVQPVSLLVHELATNAVKHGALSLEEGTISVGWRILPDSRLELRWTERGGPSVREPCSKGFGSMLISQVTQRQLEGDLEIRWQAQGFELIAGLPANVYRVQLRSEAAHDAMHEHAPAQTPAGRVLVVEDEMLVAMELCAQLSSHGWDVVGPASTLEEALGIVAREPLPSAAVLDVNLKGQAVYPLADLLRSRDIPILFCTGYEGVDAHFSEHRVIRKPTDPQLLHAELCRILARQPQTRPAAG
jgi:CheY-like chemotaxis protein